MANTDFRHLNALRGTYGNLDACVNTISTQTGATIEYPLDKDIREFLEKIRIAETDEEYKIFEYSKDIKELWGILIKKSLKCLRYFDSREPFQEKANKHPHACGVSDLQNYFEKYSEFETTLYGSSKYYRDHVMHVFRVWLIGVNLLLKDGCKYLKKIAVESGYDVNAYEKLSIWTLISLTHDLGYPLQKAMEVIERTKSMMYSFVSNPMVTMDLSFSGVQSSMNDFVLRFIGSRMWEIDPESRKTIEYTKDLFREEQERLSGLVGEDRDNYLKRKRYVARLQPKYYFKFLSY